jgi:hypothetical protein
MDMRGKACLGGGGVPSGDDMALAGCVGTHQNQQQQQQQGLLAFITLPFRGLAG